MMWTCSQTMLFINITIHIIILAAFYCLCLIKNSVIRYNISANDGGGNRGTGKDNPGGAGGYNYKEQSIFHYWVKNDGAAMPTIHNNTIYVGDGISTSLFGEGNSSDNSGTVANFTIIFYTKKVPDN